MEQLGQVRARQQRLQRRQVRTRVLDQQQPRRPAHERGDAGTRQRLLQRDDAREDVRVLHEVRLALQKRRHVQAGQQPLQLLDAPLQLREEELLLRGAAEIGGARLERLERRPSCTQVRRRHARQW